MTDESQRPSQAFRARLRDARERAGLKQSDLAARCDAAGEPSYRQTTIAKLENGDRGVSLDDVFVLADCLEVPPGWLMTPTAAGAVVILTSTSAAEAATVRKWIAGHKALVPADDRGRIYELSRLLHAVAPEEEVAIGDWPLMHGLRQRVNHLLDGAFEGDRDTLRQRLEAVARVVDLLREDLEQED